MAIMNTRSSPAIELERSPLSAHILSTRALSGEQGGQARARSASGYATRCSAIAFADARSVGARLLAFTKAAWSMTAWLA